MPVTELHEEKETLVVDINIPGHEARTTTALFTRTKKLLIEREGGRCFVSGQTAEESGHPLEAHHHPIDPYRFVDDMTVNGMLLAKQFHTGQDAGLHYLPFPLWIAQKYGKEGYQFSASEVIHHEKAGA